MKQGLILALALGTASLMACEHPNDVATLHDEATVVAKYYQPKLDELAKRVDATFQRGRQLAPSTPGINEAGQLLGQARDRLVEMRGIAAAGPDGKSQVEKQADVEAKNGNVDNLNKLVDDTREKLDEGTTQVNEDLNIVEAFLTKTETMPAAPVAPPLPTSSATGEPTPAEQPVPAPAGEPAGQAAGKAAEGAPKAEGKAGEKAGEKAAAPKAEGKAATPKTEAKTDKKAEPKTESKTDKKAEPKSEKKAAPAAAGSAAK